MSAHDRSDCHEFMVPWLIIKVFGLDEWIYWRLLLQSLFITIITTTQNKWLLKTRSIMTGLRVSSLLDFLLLTYEWITNKYSCTTECVLKIRVEVTLRLTVTQSVIPGVEPHMGLMTKYVLLFDSCGLLFVGRPLWREDGSVFVYVTGPCQRSLSPVRVPWDSWPYFTVSDLRFPFSSPPTTHRVTVEVFDPTSTRVVCVICTAAYI
jgi:hypothetical protein